MCKGSVCKGSDCKGSVYEGSVFKGSECESSVCKGSKCNSGTVPALRDGGMMEERRQAGRGNRRDKHLKQSDHS